MAKLTIAAEIERLIALRRAEIERHRKGVACCQQNIDQLHASMRMEQRFLSEAEAALAELERLRG